MINKWYELIDSNTVEPKIKQRRKKKRKKEGGVVGARRILIQSNWFNQKSDGEKENGIISNEQFTRGRDGTRPLAALFISAQTRPLYVTRFSWDSFDNDAILHFITTPTRQPPLAPLVLLLLLLFLFFSFLFLEKESEWNSLSHSTYYYNINICIEKFTHSTLSRDMCFF